MGRELILETTFLIDLEREMRLDQTGPARAALLRHAEDRLHLTFTTVGELACGSSLSNRKRWEAFIAPFHVIPSTTEVCWEYGKAYRYLRDAGQLIGTNDLWIAAAALARDMPVVTANEEHFRRVPGVEVLGYRS